MCGASNSYFLKAYSPWQSLALLTVYELVCVVALTYWVKRTHRVEPGRKFVFSLYPKSYSIVKMCTWGLKYKKSIYTKWTIYCFCKLHRSMWNCVPIIGIIFFRLSLVHYHMRVARCFKLIFLKAYSPWQSFKWVRVK